MPRVATKKSTTSRRPRTYSRPARPARSAHYAVRGRGGYWDNVKKRWGEDGGTMKNQFSDAGGIIAGPVGRQVGGFLNRALYALTGFGDYVVKKNVLLETNGPPAVMNSGKEFVMRHREYIQDIYSATGTANTPSPFAIQSYPINPGQAQTFPWGASIATNFEQYTVEGMVFEYKSLYSDSVVTQNGSIGSVMLATEYNAGTPVFTNKQQMENYQFAQSAKPSQSILHPIECARPQNVLSELYVRSGAVPSGEDVKTYDFGDFQIASQGIPLGAAGAAVNLGELWISYQISLKKPKLLSSNVYVDSGFAAFSSKVGLLAYGPDPFTTGHLVKLGSTNMDVSIPTSNTLRVALTSVPQTLQINASWTSNNVLSASAVWRAPAIVTNSNVVLQNISIFSGDYVSLYNPKDTNKIDIGCFTQVFVKIPAASASLSYVDLVFNQASFNIDQSTEVRCDIYINRVPTVLVG